jgi:hypothetical protein
MMIRLNWSEFVRAAYERLQQLNPTLELKPPQFMKDHGSYSGGIGEAYEVPDFVDFEVTPK